MADSDVTDMLTTWGLSEYIDKFKEECIDISTLTLLTGDMVKELIPKIGHRAKFMTNLEEWRKVLNITNDQVSACLFCWDINNFESNSLLIEIPSPSTSNSTTPANEDSLNFLISEPSTPKESLSPTFGLPHNLSPSLEKECELNNYLQSCTEGKALLATYKDRGLLDNSGRRKICNLIVRKELQYNPEKVINSHKILSLAKEIVQIFPKEHISTYFIPYMNFGPTIKKAAKGKLLDCFNNRRREYKKAGIITSTPVSHSPFMKQGSQLELLDFSQQEDSDVDDQITWLQNSSDPWNLVEKYWVITRQKRLKNVLDTNPKDLFTISDYMKKFPALKKPAGYNLLIEDFNCMYPDKKEILIENFPLHKNKILELGKINSSNLKDNTLKYIINEYLSLSSASEEASHLAAFLILPFLLSPITAKRKKGKAAWKPSKLEMKDGFITHIKSHTELQDTVSRRKDKYSKLGVTLQPLIIIVRAGCV
ncbi:SAM domain-containing protein [Aphis craccivora]|uniref:SAM domain-containing protein n=1 Tax=Aphis craccivora TaxID=307492 RepID=A0A6G0VS83_APHCR|nr:SAM domain-containing protein [Aphis craccivora]